MGNKVLINIIYFSRKIFRLKITVALDSSSCLKNTKRQFYFLIYILNSVKENPFEIENLVNLSDLIKYEFSWFLKIFFFFLMKVNLV